MSTIKANTLLHSDGSTTNPPAIPALDKRMAKAWVNFNGTSTVAIRDSYNVSSITDLGVGMYYVNFTTAMADANYAATASTNRAVTWADGGVDVYNLTTSLFRVNNIENNIGADSPIMSVVVFA